MDWPTLDTRWWNLSLGVVATATMAACGPTIMLDDDDSIVDSDTDGPPTAPPDTTDPPPGNCQIHADCDDGEICVDNVCVPDEEYYYCQDGGCCYDYGDYGDCCYGDCCYGDCYYYEECFDDLECGAGSLCVYYDCLTVDPLPACNEPSDLVPLPIPEGDDPIVSLSFVDGNGDGADDLLVGREGSTQLHLGGGETVVDVPVPDGEQVVDAVSGDFDGDGVADIAYTDGVDSITILVGDGAGGFTAGNTIEVGSAVIQLEALQWDSDGALDLATLTTLGASVLHQGDGNGGLMASHTLHGNANYHTLAAGRFDPGGLEDLVAQDGDRTALFLGNDEADVSIQGSLPEYDFRVPQQRQLAASDIDGDGRSEVIGYTSYENGWLLVEAWRNGGDEYRPHAIYDHAAEHAEFGDYTGEGIPDLVLAGNGHLVLIAGTNDLRWSPLFCETEYDLGMPLENLAVGDFDGDGRAEIAVSNDTTLLVLARE